MATTIKDSWTVSDVQVKEKLSKSTLSDPYVIHRKLDNFNANASTTPDAELVYSGTVSLSDGSATLDLTSISNSEGDTIATTGKKVRVFKAKATSDNANALTLTEGASNGYALAGASWKVILEASDSVLFILNDNADAVGASDKTIDLSGTGSQSVDIIIIFG